VNPSARKWYATLAPTIAPPTITTSAVLIFHASLADTGRVGEHVEVVVGHALLYRVVDHPNNRVEREQRWQNAQVNLPVEKGNMERAAGPSSAASDTRKPPKSLSGASFVVAGLYRRY